MKNISEGDTDLWYTSPMENTEFDKFDEGMRTILRADPKAVKEAMERDKRENAEKRKAKKPPSASVPASSAKD